MNCFTSWRSERAAFLVRRRHRLPPPSFDCALRRHLGVRDRGGLEAAIFHPQNVYFYGHADRFDIAAAFAFHIAEAQAFLDGNKRTAVAAALNFLNVNGIPPDFDSAAVYNAMIAIAEKRMTRSDLAALLREQAGAQP